MPKYKPVQSNVPDHDSDEFINLAKRPRIVYTYTKKQQLPTHDTEAGNDLGNSKLYNTKDREKIQSKDKVHHIRNEEGASLEVISSKKRKRRIPVGRLVLQPLPPLGPGHLEAQVRLIHVYGEHRPS